MCTFYDHNCHLISYEQVRSLMTEPFPMSLVGEDAKAVTEAVSGRPPRSMPVLVVSDN